MWPTAPKSKVGEKWQIIRDKIQIMRPKAPKADWETAGSKWKTSVL